MTDERRYLFSGGIYELGLDHGAIVEGEWSGTKFWATDKPLRSDQKEHPKTKVLKDVRYKGIGPLKKRVQRLVKAELAPKVSFDPPEWDEENERWISVIRTQDGGELPCRVNRTFVDHVPGAALAPNGTWHWIVKNARNPNFLAYVKQREMRGLVYVLEEGE